MSTQERAQTVKVKRMGVYDIHLQMVKRIHMHTHTNTHHFTAALC